VLYKKKRQSNNPKGATMRKETKRYSENEVDAESGSNVQESGNGDSLANDTLSQLWETFQVVRDKIRRRPR
jgi:hypothetical protein